MSPSVAPAQGTIERIFGSVGFFRLWIAQVISATGDWLGLIAIISLADRLNDGSEGTAIALVLTARILPGFFLATAAGIIVDRLNRRRVMMVADLGRAAVLMALPFVDSLAGLVLASFVLELLTMLWSPAKEALVPSLVPAEKLTSANSLNVAAAYGMFPVAAGIAALLAKVAESLADTGWIDTLRLNQEGLAFYVDGLSFLATALIVSTIVLPSGVESAKGSDRQRGWGFGGALGDLKEGWRVIVANPVVRAVNIGLSTGVIGGGMLVPLGAIYVNEVISGDEADFNLVLFSLGTGMAVGVGCASVLQNRINRTRLFPAALLLAGFGLLSAGASSVLWLVVPAVGLVGFAAGPVYVLGFTLLHENVNDELRGRIFAALLVLVRLCVLLALALAPLLSELFDQLSAALWDRQLSLAGGTVFVPGVRLTIWLAAVIVSLAGVLALVSLRRPGPNVVTGEQELG